MGFYLATPVGVGDQTRVLRSLDWNSDFQPTDFRLSNPAAVRARVPASEMTSGCARLLVRRFEGCLQIGQAGL